MSSSSSFRKSATYEEVLKEYSIAEFSASEFKLIAFDKLGDLIIRELQHYKEARSYSRWEHEFLIAKMYHPHNSGALAGVLLIDREQRPGSPDIVRVVPGDTLHSNLTFLSRLGYHPSNLGRSSVFASHPSVSEIASVFAKKSRAGGEYTVHNHNCYWYAREVFDHCLDAYGGSITDGPYFDDLGTFMQDAPKAFVAEVRMDTVARTTGVVASIVLGSFTTSSLFLAASVVAITTYAWIWSKKANLSQVEPLWWY